MEKRKDHFSDWQLPSQTSFNKKKKGLPALLLKGQHHYSALWQQVGCSGPTKCVMMLFQWWGSRSWGNGEVLAFLIFPVWHSDLLADYPHSFSVRDIFLRAEKMDRAQPFLGLVNLHTSIHTLISRSSSPTLIAYVVLFGDNYCNRSRIRPPGWPVCITAASAKEPQAK